MRKGRMRNWATAARGATVCAFLWLSAAAAETPSFTTTESGLKYAVTERGSGPSPRAGQVVIANCLGTLDDGTEFFNTKKTGTHAFTIWKGQVIKGWDEAFRLLHVGDKALLIPPNSNLNYQVEFLEIKEAALADTLGEVIDSVGVPAAQKRFEELKAARFGSYYVNESHLNGLGYRYLGKNNNGAAIAVFLWNVELFPQSANVYDSLAEAYGKNGDQGLAKDFCRKALVIDPEIGKTEGSWCTPAKASR